MKGSQEAVTSTYAFIIAVGIMLGSVATVYSATDDIASRGIVQEVEQVNLQSEAEALKQILLASPGIIDSGDAWDETSAVYDADDLARLGLLEPDGTGIQFEKLQNLRLSPFDANATDGFANYAEVKADLGLDDKGLDFHIRTKPTLKSVEDILTDGSLRDQNLKVTYIGNVASKPSDGSAIDADLVVTNLACDEAPTGSPSWRFSVDVTNGGSDDTQFFLVFDIDSGGGKATTRQDQSAVIPAGDTDTVWVDVENTDDVTCDEDTEVEVDVFDPVQLLRTEELTGPTIGDEPEDSDGGADNKDEEFYITASVPYYVTGDAIKLSYFGDEDENDAIDLEVREGTDGSGDLVHDNSTTVPKDKKDRFLTLSTADLNGTGEYTAYLSHPDSGVIATQRIVVVSATPLAYGDGGTTEYSEGDAMEHEIDFLHSLIEQFCPAYYDGTDTKHWTSPNETWSDACSEYKDTSPLWDGQVQSSDIFPDLQSDLWAMEPRLLHADGTPRYDITNMIVVGSNVAHNSMTSNNFGDPLEEWVLGGGTLVVFGSPGQSTQWLQNLFHAGQTSSSGGISAPDVSHPLLSIPEPLAYDQYETSGKGWKYTGGADEHFTDVVQQGGTPITAVSDPGDFGKGTIVLTSWLPYDLFGTGAGTASDEGLRLMYNFMMQSYRDLFVDYGPPLPEGAPAIPSAGRALVEHPDLGPVALDFTLYVFPAQ